jgi:hypothetical protein
MSRDRILYQEWRSPTSLNAFTRYGLVSSEVSHLIATLVKRLWLSCLPGLHIPATRWIGILPKESLTAAAHVPYAVLQLPPVFSPHQARCILESSHNQEGYYKWTKLILAQNAVANSR